MNGRLHAPRIESQSRDVKRPKIGSQFLLLLLLHYFRGLFREGRSGRSSEVERGGPIPYAAMHARRDDLYSNDVKRIRGRRPTDVLLILLLLFSGSYSCLWPLGLIHFLAAIRRKRPRHDISEDVRRVGGGLATGYHHYGKAKSQCNSW